MESVDIETDAGSIRLRLYPKDGEEIDIAEIEKCLDTTLGLVQ